MSSIPTYKLVCPYLIFSLTPVHAGVGRGTEEHVDMPIQRDALGIPVVWGSSIKGALRTAYRMSSKAIVESIADEEEKKKKEEEMRKRENAIFGPERGGAHEHASALMILDATLLLLPVPSLKGITIFATTPLILERVKNILDLRHNNMEYVNIINDIIDIYNKHDKTIASNEKLLLNDKLIVKNQILDVVVDEELKNKFNALLKDVSIPVSKELIVDNVVILPDHIGINILSKSTISVTRIALDYSKKVVREAALWTEEYVP